MNLGTSNEIIITIITTIIIIKTQPSYCNQKTFSIVELTLNFDLDLSKVNSEI